MGADLGGQPALEVETGWITVVESGEGKFTQDLLDGRHRTQCYFGTLPIFGYAAPAQLSRRPSAARPGSESGFQLGTGHRRPPQACELGRCQSDPLIRSHPVSGCRPGHPRDRRD